MHKVKIVLGEPVIIAQAPPLPKDQDNWGLFQFPTVERLPDGRLHVEYHIGKDSALAYGKPKGHAVSSDNGHTWAECDQLPGGIPLSGGRFLRYKIPTALPLSEVTLPEPDDVIETYGMIRRIYKAARLSEDFMLWPFEVVAADGQAQTVWRYIDVPDTALFEGEGVFPRQMFWRLRQEKSGRIWAIGYPYAVINGKSMCTPIFAVSEDEGETFTYLSRIEYEPDPLIDHFYRVRGGFGEPDIAFMPDGSILCLLRSTDGCGIGPSYRCHSHDGGKTWTKPVVFDICGVWPSIASLENGVTLASYGRPGLFMKATADPAGVVWEDRIEIVPPGIYQTDTCSYSELVPIGLDTAYLVYSEFQYPNKDGVLVKTILGRKIQVTKE